MKSIYLITLAACLISVLPHAAMASDSLTDPPLQVEVHKGRRVTLPGTAVSVVAANPDIADVQVVSPRVLYIYGKAIGETSVFAVDADENTIYDATVIVSHDISGLEREIKRMAPDAKVTFKTVDSGLVMEGNADTVAEAESIRNVAQTYLTDPTKEKVINMIKTQGSDQVMLKVKIVEMARNDLKKMGLNIQNHTEQAIFARKCSQGNTFPLINGNSNDFTYDPFSLLERRRPQMPTCSLNVEIQQPYRPLSTRWKPRVLRMCWPSRHSQLRPGRRPAS